MSDYLTYANSVEYYRIPFDTIVAIVADGNYCQITTVDSNVNVVTLQLGQIESLINGLEPFPDNIFIRIGKSLIVNSRYISYLSIAKQKIVLSDGRSFRFTHNASREALRALKQYLEGK